MKLPITIPKAGVDSIPARRVIHPEIKIVSDADGTVDYTASDQSIDVYAEVIVAAGWRFDSFAKNAPFVDSHNYNSIGDVLGRVIDWRVMGNQLVERVQWAKDMPNTLASWGWKMLTGGFLKAVSVGFWPTRYVTKWDNDKQPWLDALKALGLHEEDGVNVIYLEQQQVELSACVLGANPNAVARAFKAGALSEEDIDRMATHLTISGTKAPKVSATRGTDPEPAAVARTRSGRTALMLEARRIANRD